MRDTWQSSNAFIMTSIGAALGLGNILRFPFLVARYGLLFIFVYLFFLMFAGLPILLTETAMGRKYRQSSIGCMEKVNKKAQILGFFMIFNSFIIMCYYGVLFAFIILMAFYCYKLPLVNLEKVPTFFYDASGYSSETITPIVIIFLILAWSTVCASSGKAEKLGKIATPSVILPLLFLIALSIKGIVNNPQNLSVLFTIYPQVLTQGSFWVDVVGQVFFSLSIMIGVMFAFGSFLEKDENILKSVTVISLADFGVSILSSVVYLSVMPVNSGFLSGITSGFSAYPLAILSLTENKLISSALIFLFYGSLALLTLNSLFSYLKSVTSAVFDKYKFTEEKSSTIICIICCAMGFLFLGKGGLNRLNIADSIGSEFLLIVIGFFEVAVIAKWGDLKGILNEINLNTKRFYYPEKIFFFCIKYFCPIIILLLIISYIK